MNMLLVKFWKTNGFDPIVFPYTHFFFLSASCEQTFRMTIPLWRHFPKNTIRPRQSHVIRLTRMFTCTLRHATGGHWRRSSYNTKTMSENHRCHHLTRRLLFLWKMALRGLLKLRIPITLCLSHFHIGSAKTFQGETWALLLN